MKNIAKEISKKLNPIASLQELLKNDVAATDKIIEANIINKIEIIPKLASYTLAGGGKRLRPLLTLACAKLCNYQGTSHIDLAAAVEFIHTATLLHDDVVDGSSLRRGREVANIVWSNKSSILVGDFLFAKAFQLMKTSNSTKIYETLSNASVIIASGEVMQLSTPTKLDKGLDNYFAIIKAKTAELFSASCKVGAILANCSDDRILALNNFGLNLGIAFQIIDDTLDYQSDNKQFGKAVGNDLLEKKVTLPVIIAYDKADANDKALLERCFEGDADNSLYLNDINAIFRKYQAVDDSILLAKDYLNKASDSLAIFPESKIRDLLLATLDFVVNRKL